MRMLKAISRIRTLIRWFYDGQIYFPYQRMGMTIVIHFYDGYQQCYSPFFLAEKVLARETNVTILIELTGISIAATKGDKSP